MTKLLLGIDYGTGGCKVTVLDETGAFVGEASTEYVTYHDHPGWSEQEPGDWGTSLKASLDKLRAKGVDLAQVSACSLDGSTHNAVLLDEDYKPVRRTIMWTDQRATAECEALVRGAARGLEREDLLHLLPDARAHLDSPTDDVAQGQRAGGAREDRSRAVREGLRALSPHR